MAQRRDRQPVQRSGNSIGLRFPDGSVRTMPIEAVDPVTSDLCCFCGESLENSDSERILLSARWLDDGRERTQSWEAHRACLAARMHESSSGTGPFFGD